MTEENNKENNLEKKVERVKPFYRRPSFYVGLYLATTIFSTPLVHLGNRYFAKREVEISKYGPNLKKMWDDYADKELKDIFSYKTLIPLSSMWMDNETPPGISVTDGNGNAFPVDIDEKGTFIIHFNLGEVEENK